MAQDSLSRFRAFVEDVKQRNHLVDVMTEDGVAFERSGNDWKCLSPFRKEKTPSFFVYQDGGWYDFGTYEGGDVFNYVMRRDGIDFKEAVILLANRIGAEPYWKQGQDDSKSTPETIQDIKDQVERETVFEMLTDATGCYHAQLPSKIRENYFKKVYGFTDETIDRWKLGYGNSMVGDYFVNEKGYSREAALRTGLFIRNADLSAFFESRLVFPYWSGGKVVYMIGRRTEYTSDADYEKAKYKKLLTHSEKHPHVSKHVKNDWFWNEDVCKKPLKRLVITEGITDVIAAVQHGFDAISPVTVRFKTDQIEKLVKLTERVDTVYLCNDADVLEDGRRPGEEGAISTANVLFRAGRDVRIVQLPLPEGQKKVDLCEFLRDYGKDAFEALIQQAKPFATFIFDKISIDGIDASEVEAKLAPVFEMIAACASDVAREKYVKQVVDKYGITKKTVNKCIREAKKKIPDAPKSQDSDDDTDDSKPDSIPPKTSSSSSRQKMGDRVRGEVLEEILSYYVENQNGLDETISSFVLRPTKSIRLGSQLCLTCDVETINGKSFKDVTFPPKAWGSKRDFIRSIEAYPDMQWMGSDDHVQGLLKLLREKPVPVIVGSKTLGYFESENGPRWVFPSGVIDSNGIQKEPDVTYVTSGSSLDHRVFYEDIEKASFSALAAEVLPKLSEINTHDVTIPMIGWFFATPFKPRIHKQIHHFPLLFVHGTQGSGKTSMLREVFWPLFGVALKTDPYSCTETEFALVRLFSSTNSIPVVLDEFKPRDMGKVRVDRINRFLRRLYGGETEERGRADLSITTWDLSAPVCIAGEMGPEDPAIIERSILVSPNKTNLTQNSSYIKTFHRLRQFSLYQIAIEYLKWSFSRDVKSELEDAHRYTKELLALTGQKVEQRVFDNIMVMLFGVAQFDAWCDELGIETPSFDIVEVVRSLVDRILEGGSDGGSVKDAFDSFLEELSTYAHTGALREDVHYAIVNDKLCIHLRSCYEAYLTERKKTGREDETNGRKALIKIAKEKSTRGGYVVNDDKRVWLGATFARCVEIDTFKIPATLDVSFPSTTKRTWGGNRYNTYESPGGDAE